MSEEEKIKVLVMDNFQEQALGKPKKAKEILQGPDNYEGQDIRALAGLSGEFITEEESLRASLEREKSKYQELNKQVIEAGQMLQHALQEIKKKQDELVDAIAKEVTDMAFVIAEQLLAHEMTLQPSIVIDNIHKVLDDALSENPQTLYFNPQDFQFLQAEQPKLLEDIKSKHEIKIETDSSVAIGACRLESNDSYFEANVFRSLQCLRREIDTMEPVQEEETEPDVAAAS